MTERTNLISPYGGNLVDLVAFQSDRAELFSFAAGLPSIQLTRRETCDLEMISIGAFSPLAGFITEHDYKSVLEDMRLSNGTVFPIPVTLTTNDLTNIHIGCDIALRDPKNDLLAVMNISEIYEWDREQFAVAVCGTTDARHPLVAEMREWGRFNLSGGLRVITLPEYHDFQELRLTPKQTRDRLSAMGRENVVAFQTRNPMHRAHEVMTQKSIEITDGSLLLQPTVGLTKKGDIDYFTRVQTYKAVSDLAYPSGRVLLSLLPLAMRMAGPREAVWHAIIRRNYGANHLIVGRGHASPGTDANGDPFYEPQAAQTLAIEYSSEIGVNILPFQEFAYLPDERRYEQLEYNGTAQKYYSLSGTRIREEFLGRGKNVPQWFMRKEVAAILSESYPPRSRPGACLWFTGLSGAGKSTTAEIVAALLLEEGRQVTLLDGDVVRTDLSKGLGFSKKDRDINVGRIGIIASEVVRHGGIAICAAISPYRDTRRQVRSKFKEEQFIEIFIDTPLNICEERDTKGLYAKARMGEIENFTGIDDAYEIPASPEIVLYTIERTARCNAQLIVEYLRSKGFLIARPDAASHTASSAATLTTALNLKPEVIC